MYNRLFVLYKTLTLWYKTETCCVGIVFPNYCKTVVNMLYWPRTHSDKVVLDINASVNVHLTGSYTYMSLLIDVSCSHVLSYQMYTFSFTTSSLVTTNELAHFLFFHLLMWMWYWAPSDHPLPPWMVAFNKTDFPPV